MARYSGLKAARDTLCLAYDQNIIDEYEFVLLYDANKSREIFPYWKYEQFDFSFWSNTECKTELRFEKNDVYILLHLLGIPNKIVCCQGNTCSGIEALCILLKRLAYPCRYTDIVYRFGRNPTAMSLIFNEVLDIIYDNNHHRLDQWNHTILGPQQIQEYANAVHAKGAPLKNCFGFIDGTLREISRPKYHQRLVYNGHKRRHGLKFQSVVVPNGIIANLQGPYEGRKHDCSMLYETNLLNSLRQNAWSNGEPLCVYGDPAYPLNPHLQMPFKGAQITPDMVAYNKAMSEVRVTVEWLFGNITTFFKFIDFKKQMKIGLSPVGKLYVVCALLENARTCLYGNIVSSFFNLDPPTIHEYFQ